MPRFVVTKFFVNGILAGLSHTETTSVEFEVGRTYKAVGGSDYTVTSCVRL